MILTCPNCATRYFADVTAIGQGRKVRCAACGEVWRAEPEDEAALAADMALPSSPPLSAPDPLAIDGPFKDYDPATARSAFRFDAKALARASWAPALAVAVAMSAAWMFRTEVVAFWPETSSVYAMVGIRATASGLVFEDVEAQSGRGGVVTVTATVRNVSGRVRAAPLVRVQVREESGEVAAQAFAALTVSSLAPEEVVAFSTDIPAPGVSVSRVELTFQPVSGEAPFGAPPSDDREE